jgi:DNA-binding CsgD family transcriptional regulator
LIRIAILASTSERARQFAALLAEDDRLEIVDARAWSGRFVDIRADVVLAVGVAFANVADLRSPVVLLAENVHNPARNVRAVLPVSASLPEISAAIEAAAQDLTVLTADQASRWIPVNEPHLETENPVEHLTARELQVLRMLADGTANKDIAMALAISEHTVKFHVAQIFAKLNAGSRTEAVAIGIRRGLIAI